MDNCQLWSALRAQLKMIAAGDTIIVNCQLSIVNSDQTGGYYV